MWARDQEWQRAEKLTAGSNSAQRGNLVGGALCWIYEVKWAGSRHKNTYEPASWFLPYRVIGWEREMYETAALLPTINPAAEVLTKAQST